ncbi:calpastatin-like isoform X2 [Erpetoichthys calabaricus]|uniref:calpastatin-like isoform X2 n=1 Tax=Erpetoichthys calabaricus TaxID=27687 RepID=UPI0022347352|nr:calpastatin-like isoform X2 [Erpetoichthys calabaricus]
MAFAKYWMMTHGDTKAAEDSKGATPAAAAESQPKSSSTTAGSKASSMKPADSKDSTKQAAVKTAQSTKPADPASKAAADVKPKEAASAKQASTKSAAATEKPAPPTGGTSKAKGDPAKPAGTAKPAEQKPAQSTSTAAKATATAAGTATVAAAGAATVAAAGTATVAAAKEGAEAKKHEADSALDALAGSLTPQDVPAPKTPKYTGPEVNEKKVTSTKGVRLGDRDDTIPPEYRFKDDGQVPPKLTEKKPEVPKTPVDEKAAIDAFLDFDETPLPKVDSSASNVQAAGPDVITAQSAGLSHAAAPPANTKAKEDQGMSLAALDALGDSLGVPDTKPEPPQPLPKDIVKDKLTATHVDKLGERDDTLPPGYRFPADKDKKNDGAKPAEGPKTPVDQNAAIDALDFDSPTVQPAVSPIQQPAGTPSVKSTAAPTQQSATAPDIKSTAAPTQQSAAAPAVKSTAAPTQQSAAAPAVKSTAAPTQQSAAAPAVKSTAAPTQQSAAVPAVKSTAAPTQQSAAAPAVKSTAAPTQQSAAAPAVKSTAAPTQQSAVAPDVKSTTAAPIQQSAAAPAVKSSAAPTQQSAAAPDVKSTAAPTQQSAAAPAVKTPAAPTLQSPAAPAVKSPAAPTQQSAAAPAVKSPAAPTQQSPAAPAVKSPAAPSQQPAAAPTQQSAAPSAQKSEAPTPDKAKTPAGPTSAQGQPAHQSSMDSAMDALSGSLLPIGPTPTAKPEPVVDKVKEKATSKHVDKLGERDDTIPPEYRFEDKDKKGSTPAPQQPKTPVDPSAAIDALAGDFELCSESSTVQSSAAPTLQSSAAPTLKSAAAPTLQSAAGKPPQDSKQMSAGTDSALDALSGTLMPDIPAPEPKPVPPSAVVKENIKEKHIPKLGDNENTIPPEYRMKLEKGSEGGSKEEDKPKTPKQIAKEQNSAIDALAEGFDSQPPEKVEDKKDAAGSASNSALSTKSPEKDPKATKTKEQQVDPKKTGKS